VNVRPATLTQIWSVDLKMEWQSRFAVETSKRLSYELMWRDGRTDRWTDEVQDVIRLAIRGPYNNTNYDNFTATHSESYK